MAAVRLAVAQINTVVGDVGGNARRVLGMSERAYAQGCDIVVFPELTIPGYPAEDLLLKPAFLEENARTLVVLASQAPDLVVVVGFPRRGKDSACNSAAVISGPGHIETYDKRHLPNYGVFDEIRYFEPGEFWKVFDAGPFRFGLTICEDIWVDHTPTVLAADVGADFVVNLSASPYHMRKAHERQELLASRARRAGTWLVYCNLVGGQDELVFDGASMVLDSAGELVAVGEQFEEDLLIVDIELEPERERGEAELWADLEVVELPNRELREGRGPAPPRGEPTLMSREEEIWSALALGVRDYVGKNGFQKVVLGLSGGIDSALTAAVAVDALGNENVTGVSMPSRFSSQATQEDARRVAESLGIDFLCVPIDKLYTAYMEATGGVFTGLGPDVTEENIQARIRGNLLMALSNKFGWMVLSTGNKSEVSVGYCTLYGDMTGGFAALKDVFKTLVYDLARYLNRREDREVIPQSIIDRPPSAELRPGQADQDSLPPYDVLDGILRAYLEADASAREIIAKGYDADVVQRTIRMVDRNEYKRRQAPPGVKITPRAFGRDRRWPITNAFEA